MKLTLKHVAIFGRIQVDLQSLSGNMFRTIDLLTLYKEGWFVTERFGTVISLCKRKQNGEFLNRFRFFKTDVNLETFDLLWKPIADEKFAKYKEFLYNNNRKIYRKRKVVINENKVSML